MFFLAFHKEENEHQIALIKRAKGTVSIEHVRSLPVDVKPLDILQPLLPQKKLSFVTGLSSSQVVLRSLALKLKSKREIRAALPFQIEHLLPYPKQELIVLPSLVPHKDKETDIFLLATSKQEVQNHLDGWAPLGIDPDIVSCVPMALFRFARHFFKEAQTLCHFHIGREQSCLILIEEGRLTWTQSQTIGTHSLQEKRDDVTREIERRIAYIQKRNPRIDQILLTGKATEEVAPFFTPHFRLMDDPLKDPLYKEYAVPIGLALDGASRDASRAQFRLRSHPSTRQKARLARLRSSFLVGCAALCLATLCMGHFALQQREKRILASLKAPEATKLTQWIDQLEHSIAHQKTGQVPMAFTPQVTDLLTFLSTHPLLAGEGVAIEKIRYTLTSPPKLGTKIAASSAKVELKLSLPSAADARAFHQALLHEPMWIDHKQGVEWSGDHGHYQAIFTFRGGR